MGCNGGAFFWVALHDINGAWSDAVGAEVRKTAGCSHTGGGSDNGGDGGTGIDGTTEEAPCDDGSDQSCKNQCYAVCRGLGSDVQTNQCWGMPRYIECECRDGSTHTHAGCVCENESCPSTVGRIEI